VFLIDKGLFENLLVATRLVSAAYILK